MNGGRRAEPDATAYHAAAAQRPRGGRSGLAPAQ
jgi:hypothetical protein